jgi:hypothetical protein
MNRGWGWGWGERKQEVRTISKMENGKMENKVVRRLYKSKTQGAKAKSRSFFVSLDVWHTHGDIA